MGVYYNSGMIELSIPGRGTLQLDHLVCDINGTIALDGKLIENVARPLVALKDRLTLHLVTANTHARVEAIEHLLGLTAVQLGSGDEAEQKAAYVRRLGALRCVAIGNGCNDALMLREAALGIAVLGREGLAGDALAAADIFVPDIFCAFDLLEKPLRIVATLRK